MANNSTEWKNWFKSLSLEEKQRVREELENDQNDEEEYQEPVSRTRAQEDDDVIRPSDTRRVGRTKLMKKIDEARRQGENRYYNVDTGKMITLDNNSRRKYEFHRQYKVCGKENGEFLNECLSYLRGEMDEDPTERKRPQPPQLARVREQRIATGQYKPSQHPPRQVQPKRPVQQRPRPKEPEYYEDEEPEEDEDFSQNGNGEVEDVPPPRTTQPKFVAVKKPPPTQTKKPLDIKGLAEQFKSRRTPVR